MSALGGQAMEEEMAELTAAPGAAEAGAAAAAAPLGRQDSAHDMAAALAEAPESYPSLPGALSQPRFLSDNPL